MESTGRRGFDDSGFAFVFESVALSSDLDDVGVMQQAVEQCGGERTVAGEGLAPPPEQQVAGQQHRYLFVALGENLEEQVGPGHCERLFVDHRTKTTNSAQPEA